MHHVFVSGNIALDLLGSRKWRRSEPEELLLTADDLREWIDAADLTAEPVPVDDAGLRTALDLREALYRLVTARTAGSPGDQDDLDVVNRAAAATPLTPVVGSTGIRVVGELSAVLSTVARAGIDVVSPGVLELVKECGRDECTRVFVDRSRGRRRAWCGMEECGNRVNAAAYRRRRAEATAH
ncbi:ABATE domain-containing protein [Curtobacterium sp. ISL-83]|uniref:CGNR zinc finger domain-containing protein n=1 Tax=Curtobacterium sp. ISL-83 TaxID=2819145 RepID=UPI001BEA9D7A|nr:CGNR zinc finger domain-containing protein [Curtobacterium sp. ISL-83]MBT2502404.1 ABATE domain-containing protein [Curtobacterium sp. ISL-83]